MGKVDDNKQQKLNALLNAAYDLFTTQSVEKTTIAEISKAADVAKGTFYLYFKDKYEIRNRLISHESSKLFKDAVAALEKNHQLSVRNLLLRKNDFYYQLHCRCP